MSAPRKREAGSRGDDRAGILGVIKNPLVFFALALLVIEGIFGLVVTKSKMTGDQQFVCVMVMAGLFLTVVGSVVWITIKWPTHLYEDIIKVKRAVSDLKSFVDTQGFRDAVTDIVEGRLGSEHPMPSLVAGKERGLAQAAPSLEGPGTKEVDHELLTASAPEQEEAITSRILDAFRSHGDGWRTVGGVARDSGVPFEAVQHYVRSHPHLFQTSSVSPGGISLYSLRVDPGMDQSSDQQEEQDVEASP